MPKIIKGVKLRLYPNQTQINLIWQMFGNDRKVWNLMLDMAQQRYQNNPHSQFVNEYGMNYLLKPLKQEYPYLKLSDSTSFLVVNHNLALAFKAIFKHRGGYPHFKSRHSLRQSYTGRSICKVEAKRRMRLPKLGSIRTSRLDCVKPKLSVIPSAMSQLVAIIYHYKSKIQWNYCLKLVNPWVLMWALRT